MSLKKGITIIFGANIINMIFQILTNFLLPKYLSVNCYAEIKTFQLFVAYSGVLPLGYVDGMYIKYGGKNIGEIKRSELQSDLMTFVFFQTILIGVLLVGASWSGNFTMQLALLAFFPLNITGCYNLLCQATGEFGKYARITNITTVLTFTANMGLLLFHFFEEANAYLFFYVLIDFVVMSLCLMSLQKQVNGVLSIQKRTLSLSCLSENIKNGFFLMLGNFSSAILTGMDRWFIKALMDNTAFAMYSFAVSMENMMSVAITPVSTTMYNYFCVQKNQENLKAIKDKIILFATAIVACAFPAKFILEKFLVKYMASSSVIFYLFGAQIFYIIVKCFYVNLYKAQKRQRIYFAKLTAVIVVGFLFNAGLYAVLRTKEAFAIGTMLCGVVWYVLSEMDFQTIRSSWKENLFLLLSTVSYLILGTFTEALVGCALYITCLVIFGALLMRPSVMECVEMVRAMIKNKA